MAQKQFGLVALFFSLFSTVFSQHVVKGKVLDAESGQPLPSISVYLNNTSMGSTTDDKGEFVISRIPSGKFKLVVSGVGFQTYSKMIDARDSGQYLRISLKPAADLLKQLQVNPPDPDGWSKWGKLFTQIFIGTTPISFKCQIIDPDVFKFRMNEDNTLSVYADKPVQLINDALGYDITYKMEEFEYNFSTKVVVYNGYALFKDLSLTHPKKAAGWKKNRQETYKGSLLHFMRTFFVNKLESEGFEMHSLGKVVNAEKLRAKLLLSLHKRIIDTVDIQVVDVAPPSPTPEPPAFNKTVNTIDSTDYFKKALLKPDSIISYQFIPADSVGFAADSETAGFYFSDSLEVSYKFKEVPTSYKSLNRNHKHETYPVSQFVFINKMPIYVLSNGFYYGPHDLKVTGYWAWSETMATLLPYDYVPAP